MNEKKVMVTVLIVLWVAGGIFGFWIIFSDNSIENTKKVRVFEYAYQKGRLEAMKECNSRFDEVIRLMPQDLWNLTYPGLSKEDVINDSQVDEVKP